MGVHRRALGAGSAAGCELAQPSHPAGTSHALSAHRHTASAAHPPSLPLSPLFFLFLIIA